MKQGGSYIKKNPKANAELVERTKSIAEHEADVKAKEAEQAKKAGDKS